MGVALKEKKKAKANKPTKCPKNKTKQNKKQYCRAWKVCRPNIHR